MINKTLEKVIADDIKELIANNVLEKRTLEYKSQPPGNADSDRKEFLADVSSFANTIGGDLLFGVMEADGVLHSDIGVAITNVDAEISRLENMIRDGIQPRITVEFKNVEVGGQKTVLILRIKPSLEAPHRVVYKGNDRFYRRNSNGKYPMDVAELRNAFLQSSDIVTKIQRFRTERIYDIKAGDAHRPLMNNGAFLAIHIIPLSAINTSSRIDSKTLLALKEGRHPRHLSPFNASNYSPRINLDGLVMYATYDDPITRTYTQLYRSGIIEAVESDVIAARASTEKKLLPTLLIEKGVMDYCREIMALLSTLGIKAPFYIFVSLVGVKGFALAKPVQMVTLDHEIIEVEDLLLPEVVIENDGDDIEKKFRPIFDMIWNAGGISKSLNFDDNDKLKLPQL